MSFTVTRRSRPADNFTLVSNGFLRDTALSIAARGLGAWLLTHSAGFKLSAAAIQTACGTGRDKTRALLAELEAAGYLKRTRIHADGHLRGVDYEMCDEKCWSDEAPENPALADDEETDSKALGSKALGEPLHKKTNSNKTKIEEDHNDSSSSADDGVLPGMPEPLLSEKALNIEFEGWWQSYPRKVGKDAARIKYRAARKGGASEQSLSEALAAHAAGWQREQRPKAYIPHAATWLGQGRYADEDLPGAGGAARPTNTRYDGAYWAGQQGEERDENGHTAEDRLMIERHGVTISYGS
jgi:hypothetical protein